MPRLEGSSSEKEEDEEEDDDDRGTSSLRAGSCGLPGPTPLLLAFTKPGSMAWCVPAAFGDTHTLRARRMGSRFVRKLKRAPPAPPSSGETEADAETPSKPKLGRVGEREGEGAFDEPEEDKAEQEEEHGGTNPSPTRGVSSFARKERVTPLLWLGVRRGKQC